MRMISLESAAIEILQACQQSKRQGLPLPFFFMAGAGISHPPLPLAAQIQEACKEEARQFGKTESPTPGAMIDSYSYWFEQAYPQPENRQRFLRELMEGAFISRANFRLAHLLLENTITNLVVTPNFDDFLSRALDLFGRSHIVCDHPRTLERIDLRSQELQVIHVHGSYWFYDCCNLRAEIGERARSSSSTAFTMLSMLDDLLWARSPLVVGYSGWEGDVFMTALQRRLSAALRTNLYWFCYRRRDVQALPEWIRSNPNVCAVVPDEAKGSDQAEPGAPKSPDGQREATSIQDTGVAAGAAREDTVLPATAVFDRLIRTFRLDAPALTKDPLGFFAEHLTKSLLGEASDEVENDVYAIRSVVKRLQRLKETENELPTPSIVESLLENFRNAVRRSDDREAIILANQIPPSELKADQLREVSSALADVGESLVDDDENVVRAYDTAIAMVDRLDGMGQSDTATRSVLAEWLFNKAAALDMLNDSEGEMAVYDEVVQRFGADAELPFREHVARALVNKGIVLGGLDRSRDAIAVYDQVVLRYGDATELPLTKRIALAMVNKGAALARLDREVDAIEVYDEVMRRFGEAADMELTDQIARAMVYKGVALERLDRSEEAISVYDGVVRQFSDASKPTLRQQVAAAMINKGLLLETLARSEEAVEVYSNVVRIFAGATAARLRERVAAALLRMGNALGTLNRSEEELRAYEEVVQRFGAAANPALRRMVALALLNRGSALFGLNRHEEEISSYEEVVRRFGDASELPLRERVAVALVNKGVALGALKRMDEEIEVSDEVVRRFGGATELTLREALAKALVNKGLALASSSRLAEAIVVFDDVVERFGGDTEPSLREQVAKAIEGRQDANASTM